MKHVTSKSHYDDSVLFLFFFLRDIHVTPVYHVMMSSELLRNNDPNKFHSNKLRSAPRPPPPPPHSHPPPPPSLLRQNVPVLSSTCLVMSLFFTVPVSLIKVRCLQLKYFVVLCSVHFSSWLILKIVLLHHLVQVEGVTVSVSRRFFRVVICHMTSWVSDSLRGIFCMLHLIYVTTLNFSDTFISQFYSVRITTLNFRKFSQSLYYKSLWG